MRGFACDRRLLGSRNHTHLHVVCRESSLGHLEAKRCSIRTGSCINKSFSHCLELEQQERNLSCQKQSRSTQEESRLWSLSENLSHWKSVKVQLITVQ